MGNTTSKTRSCNLPMLMQALSLQDNPRDARAKHLKASKYYLDESLQKTEISRLDTQHQLWLRLLDGRLYTAPTSSFASHLDIGCGSGVWTSHMAQMHTCARICGVDLTPPTNVNQKKNLNFVEGNALGDWDFADTHGAPYNFITARVLVAGINDWGLLFQRCYEHLQPGGWLEIHDIQIGTFSDSFDWEDESSPLMAWYQCFRRGAAMEGIDGFASGRRVEDLEAAGFQDVHEEFHRCYLDQGTEGLCIKDQEMARLTMINALSLIDSVTKVMAAKAKWDVIGVNHDELLELRDEAKDDILMNAGKRAYYWVFSVHTGRKSPT